jgi:hypothetical protein
MCASRGGLPGLPDEADYDAYPDGSWYHYGGRDKAEYLLRPTLVYKPKDLNRDWSPRFSALRDKNGWI